MQAKDVVPFKEELDVVAVIGFIILLAIFSRVLQNVDHSSLVLLFFQFSSPTNVIDDLCVGKVSCFSDSLVRACGRPQPIREKKINSKQTHLRPVLKFEWPKAAHSVRLSVSMPFWWTASL
jgi:hypothetical protein